LLDSEEGVSLLTSTKAYLHKNMQTND